MATRIEIANRAGTDRKVTLQVWIDEKWVLLSMPFSLDVLTMDGPIMGLVQKVCGKDAVVVADVSQRLDGMAFSARSTVDAWRDRLGLVKP